MHSGIEGLVIEIETMRKVLEKSSPDVNDLELLTKSQQLDKLIVMYYKLAEQNCKNCAANF